MDLAHYLLPAYFAGIFLMLEKISFLRDNIYSHIQKIRKGVVIMCEKKIDATIVFKLLESLFGPYVKKRNFISGDYYMKGEKIRVILKGFLTERDEDNVALRTLVFSDNVLLTFKDGDGSYVFDDNMLHLFDANDTPLISLNISLF